MEREEEMGGNIPADLTPHDSDRGAATVSLAPAHAAFHRHLSQPQSQPASAALRSTAAPSNIKHHYLNKSL